MSEANLTPAARGAARGAIIAAICISLLILLLWIAEVSTLVSLGDSDAAGNGLAEAYAGFEIILLWGLLVVLLVVAGINGAMPWPAAAAGVVLIPASGVAAMTALGLLADHNAPPFLWPIVTPALVPPLVVVFAFWTLIPQLRSTVPAGITAGTAWGITLLLCVCVWPMADIRHRAEQREADVQVRLATDYANMPPNAPLWDWAPFLQTRNDIRVGEVLQRISKLDRRQSDAEVMLDRGDFPLRYLGYMELDPTPVICDKARNLLRRRVQPLVLKVANSRPYTDIADDVAAALAAMQWLTGHGCPCAAEAQAWETMANAYRDTNFDVVELKELHQ
jgi:hypothetical protein